MRLKISVAVVSVTKAFVLTEQTELLGDGLIIGAVDKVGAVVRQTLRTRRPE